ncbi:MAG: 3-dehydroquinate synthase [Nitrospiria bacterium]
MKQKKPIHLDLGKNSYDVHIAEGEIDRIGERLQSLSFKGKVAVVTNPKIEGLYGGRVNKGLKKSGYRPIVIQIPAGERYKTLKQIGRIYDRLVAERFERKDVLVALGGGVIGDMTGFAAATFLRGVSFVQIPTTVVAQVDASIGGKTGVDHPNGKNLIGAFHQPRFVSSDPAVLSSLQKREYRSGLAEVVKYGVIADAGFFQYLEQNSRKIRALDLDKVSHCIERSSEIKARIVQSDERESGLRKILNYGHTIGHAVETLTGYRSVKHGEGVAMGMIAASRLSVQLGLLSPHDVERQISLLRAFGLPTRLPDLDPGAILDVMLGDKKVVGGEIHFVLPKKIGSVEIMKVDKKVLRRFLKALPKHA